MSTADIDQLRLAYKKATDEWVDSIRAEEALALGRRPFQGAGCTLESDGSARSLQRRASCRQLWHLAGFGSSNYNQNPVQGVKWRLFADNRFGANLRSPVL
jgi:hypothetical protein